MASSDKLFEPLTIRKRRDPNGSSATGHAEVYWRRPGMAVPEGAADPLFTRKKGSGRAPFQA